MANIRSPAPSPRSATPMPAKRQALLAAFAELALSRRYRDFGVEAIVRAANVARATFYYHFAGKDDLLLHNLVPLIAAQMPSRPQPTQELGYWVAHIWEQRGVARRLLTGTIGYKIEAALVAGLNKSFAAQHPRSCNRRRYPCWLNRLPVPVFRC
jgi:Bacterial regulatory proteins, tetR family